jgi:hypothetical protein
MFYAEFFLPKNRALENSRHAVHQSKGWKVLKTQLRFKLYPLVLTKQVQLLRQGMGVIIKV